MAAILLAAAFMAEGGVLLKKFPPNPPVMTNAVAMTVGGLILALASLAGGERWVLPTRAVTWTAWLFLTFFVTIAAFLLYLFVLGRWSASGTSYGFVLLPLVTIVLASPLGGEGITWSFLAGAGLVLAGVFVGALLPLRGKPGLPDECRDSSGQVLLHCT